jgi:hypothetical protein
LSARELGSQPGRFPIHELSPEEKTISISDLEVEDAILSERIARWIGGSLALTGIIIMALSAIFGGAPL